MFSRHFNDPAADSYFTKRKWGGFVFSLFFGPTVFGPLLHFDYQCSISSICVFSVSAPCSYFKWWRILKKEEAYIASCSLAAFKLLSTNLRCLLPSRETDTGVEDVLMGVGVFLTVGLCVFVSVTWWGGFEETVAETRPVAGAAWPTYRNIHRGSKTIQTTLLLLSGENISSKP